MKSRIAQYLNEIVSITIMMLMVMALIAGQMTSADAVAADEARRVEYSVLLHIPGD